MIFTGYEQEGVEYKGVYKNLSNLYCKEELDKILDEMKKQKFIKENKDNNNESYCDKVDGDITMITLIIIQKCNLRCSYCFGDNGTYSDSGIMDIKTAKKSIDFLLEKSKSEFLTVCFFGGEPLLNFRLIKEVIDYCKQKEVETNKKIGFTMTTNGTLINEDIEKYIINNRIKVQLSIDGDKQIHDSNRYFSGKVGSHDVIINKTKSLRE